MLRSAAIEEIVCNEARRNIPRPLPVDTGLDQRPPHERAAARELKVAHQGPGDVEGYSKGHIRRNEKADDGSPMRSITHSKRLGRSGRRQKILLLHKDTSFEEFNKNKAIPQSMPWLSRSVEAGRLAANAEKSPHTTPPSASRLPGRQHGPFPGPWTSEAGVPGVAAGTTRDFQNLPDSISVLLGGMAFLH